VALYDIKPLLIVKLPPKTTHQGCCGPIEKWEYSFSYTEKSNPSNSGIFHTGSGCGNDFISLLGAVKPTSFSAFKTSHAGSTSSTSGGGVSISPHQFTPLNQEAYNALSILVTIYGKLDDAVKSLLEILIQAPTKNLSDGAIKYLNGVIARRAKGTLTQAIQASPANSAFRSFSFVNINSCLAKQGQSSNF
jgi:uncharacterized spore protein YtfJ